MFYALLLRHQSILTFPFVISISFGDILTLSKLESVINFALPDPFD